MEIRRVPLSSLCLDPSNAVNSGSLPDYSKLDPPARKVVHRGSCFIPYGTRTRPSPARHHSWLHR